MKKIWRIPVVATLLALLGLHVIFYNFLQMLSLILLPFWPTGFRRFNRALCDNWFHFMQWIIENPAGIEIVFTGDQLPVRENAFVMGNHQAMADIPIFICTAHRSDRKGDLKWFVKDALKWVPGIGWGMQFLDCLFVKRNWTADKDMVTATFQRLRTHHTPFWIISFLEGTRAKPEKIARSQEYARKAGLPVLKNVLLPRAKGFTASLEGLGSLTQAVYDLTLAYETPPPSLGQFFFDAPTVHVHRRRFTQWPADAEAQGQWLVERFREKDALLDHFRQHGKFPG